MSGYKSFTSTLHREEYDALYAVLNKRGINALDYIDQKVREIYEEIVPAQERYHIRRQLDYNRYEDLIKSGEIPPFSVYRTIRDGEIMCYKSNAYLECVDLATQYAIEIGRLPPPAEGVLPFDGDKEITQEQFEAFVRDDVSMPLKYIVEIDVDNDTFAYTSRGRKEWLIGSLACAVETCIPTQDDSAGIVRPMSFLMRWRKGGYEELPKTPDETPCPDPGMSVQQ